MARGIDTIAHESAIHSHHRTCAVLGSGFNHCYPAINELLFEYLKKYELVVSEYPPEVPPSPEKFPLRNRIIAGLSQKLLVTYAKRISGTSITIGFAVSMGRDVLCVPSNELTNSATNLAIKQGAYLVEDSDDINQFFI